MPTKKGHTKGAVAPGKVVRNWRILKGVDKALDDEVTRLGFSSKPEFLNTLLTRYFNGEIIQRKIEG